VLTANEQVNEKMVLTAKASAITRAIGVGEFDGCEVEGLIAFNAAISKETARHKHIERKYPAASIRF
jgi:phosphotransacetylase